MLHFHSHQSADAVPGKLHNDVDITKWLCKKEKNSIFWRKTCAKNPNNRWAQCTLVCGVILPCLDRRGLRSGSTSPTRGTVLTLLPKDGSRRAHFSLSIPSLEPWQGLSPNLTWLKECLFLPCWAFYYSVEMRVLRAENLKMEKKDGFLELHNDASKHRK